MEEHWYRCGHVWTPRPSCVRACARCKSRYDWFPKVVIPTYGAGLGIEEVIGSKREGVRRLSRSHGATNVRVFGSVGRKRLRRKATSTLLWTE
jgi:hypothetical protein